MEHVSYPQPRYPINGSNVWHMAIGGWGEDSNENFGSGNEWFTLRWSQNATVGSLFPKATWTRLNYLSGKNHGNIPFEMGYDMLCYNIGTTKFYRCTHQKNIKKYCKWGWNFQTYWKIIAPPHKWIDHFLVGWFYFFLVGGFKHVLCFHILGIRWTTDFHIFQMAWNHQPVSFFSVGVL